MILIPGRWDRAASVEQLTTGEGGAPTQDIAETSADRVAAVSCGSDSHLRSSQILQFCAGAASTAVPGSRHDASPHPA